MTPEEHRDALAAEFTEAFKAKYDKGQAEHGGRLWEKDCSTFLIEEVLDFWAYARTMDAQRREAIRLLGVAVSRLSVGDGFGSLEPVAEARALLVGTRHDG